MIITTKELRLQRPFNECLHGLDGGAVGPMRMEPRHLVVLMCVMVVYLCVGAAVFNALEARNERTRKEELERDIDGFLCEECCLCRGRCSQVN